MPKQKWVNFYTKVLSKFAASKWLQLSVRFEWYGDGTISPQKIDETGAGLRELGPNDSVSSE